MAQKKTAKQKTTPKTRRNESRFYLVRTFRAAGVDMAEAVREYNDRYIHETVASGRAFIKDLGDNPRKTVDTLVDDSQAAYSDMRKKARKEINARLKTGRKFYFQARKSPGKVSKKVVQGTRTFIDDLETQTRERIESLVDSGRKALDGLEQDSRLMIDDLQKTGKNVMAKIPAKKTFEKKINNGLQAVPTYLNLPSRSDIQKLSRSMNALNQKVVRFSTN